MAAAGRAAAGAALALFEYERFTPADPAPTDTKEPGVRAQVVKDEESNSQDDTKFKYTGFWKIR